jgi:hypothetical protein
MSDLAKVEDTLRWLMSVAKEHSVTFASEVLVLHCLRLEASHLGIISLSLSVHPAWAHVGSFVQVTFKFLFIGVLS